MIRHLVLISTALTCTLGSCPLDWAEYDGECLYFGHDRRDYLGSQHDCKNRHAYLATVDNAGKANFIRQIVSVMHSNRLYRYWIGGSDFAVEGSWRWLETGTSIGPYTNWADGRPTNNGTFNCMMMEWVGDELKWVDVECNHRDVTYICETPAVSKK
ncbi:perlucin-like protein [Crassostrea virginica]|uniref:Perlucin-like protein n=1 Tax=Crassostrea virginica TaxID=6565 RepID=A0A8B8AR62_CRAVI|nr:perlucin-like protein [Crassostrea virginica]XP_022293551.1 perlucin-like protein [Crassostrea virginica]